MSAPTLGFIARPTLPPARYVPLARAVEAAGIDELWLWEDCFKETAVAGAAAVLGATDRLRVGLGVLPVPLRNVALTAMEIATIDGMFPGRLVPGVGHGVQEWMGRAGARAASPLALLREHLTALRALLAGERVTTRGRYVTLDDVALDWPPATRPPVLAAAVGPRTLRLVGEHADGVILTSATGLDGLPGALEQVGAGRRAVGREDPFAVVAFVAVARRVEHLADTRAMLARGGHDVADDAGLARLAAFGDAEQVAATLRAYADAGATTVVAEPDAHERDPEGLAAWFGQEVAPLLR
ncbi:LLM class flavin-dependent oxidoreductase [Puerhibacterium sp. TATVAM-FAB25]|uniref:LLM class flavin-dependent oxidoreductase n=1 Tax=Puerhibacterium sp. TATVAM-FAB25 TaxID=3093699 RepID=UPI0039792076